MYGYLLLRRYFQCLANKAGPFVACKIKSKQDGRLPAYLLIRCAYLYSFFVAEQGKAGCAGYVPVGELCRCAYVHDRNGGRDVNEVMDRNTVDHFRR